MPDKVNSSRIAPRQNWITPDLIRLCNLKSKLYKKYKRNPNVVNVRLYRNFSNNLKVSLRKAKQNYYETLVMSNRSNTKKLWETIYKAIGASSSSKDLPNTFVINDNSVSDPIVIANAFNDNFATIGSKLESSILPTDTSFTSYLRGSFPQTFVLFPTNVNEIITVVNNFENKSSAGKDGIPVFLIKQVIGSIAEPLALVCNTSFDTGRVPDLLKISQVCPIFKKGEKNNIRNHRPFRYYLHFPKLLKN